MVVFLLLLVKYLFTSSTTELYTVLIVFRAADYFHYRLIRLKFKRLNNKKVKIKMLPEHKHVNSILMHFFHILYTVCHSYCNYMRCIVLYDIKYTVCNFQFAKKLVTMTVR